MSTPRLSRQQIAESIARIHSQFLYGCGDHSCAIVKPVGMGTNGGCQCRPDQIAKRLLEIAVAIEEHGRSWK